MSRSWNTAVENTALHRLLSLESTSPLNLHLSDNSLQSYDRVKEYIKSIDAGYRVMTSGDLGAEVAIQRLEIKSHNTETALQMKYTPYSIPSLTNLIIWDFWAVSFHLLQEVIQYDWKKIDVFAVTFDWGNLTIM